MSPAKTVEVNVCHLCAGFPAMTWDLKHPNGTVSRVDLCGTHELPILTTWRKGDKLEKGPVGLESIAANIVELD